MRPCFWLGMFLPALLSLAATLSAQDPALTRRTPVAAALDAIRTNNEWTLSQQESLCEVAAAAFRRRRPSGRTPPPL